MTGRGPLVSVVIPTRNRRETLARTLASLEAQRCDPSVFEVVVVANACTDDTSAYLGRSTRPYPLRLVELPEPGASRARNAGALASSAPLLVFLDDDIETQPTFVDAHIDAHGGTRAALAASRRVAIGYLPARLQPERDRFAITLRGWWEAMFDRLREPGHRFAWTDLLSGNCSVSREWFVACGMFDEALACHEDYELGHRLLEAGSEMVFVEDAAGWHDDTTRVERACARKRAEGVADAWIAERYPSLRTAMPMARIATTRQRLSRWLAFSWPALGDAGARSLLRALPLLDRAGATLAWLRVLYAVLGYWYERGLADAVTDRRQLRLLLRHAWQHPRVVDPGPRLDLALGLERAEQQLDRERPGAAQIVVGDRPIGRLRWVPGSEPLAGRHLVPYLRKHHHQQVVRALIEHGALAYDTVLQAAPAETQDEPLRASAR